MKLALEKLADHLQGRLAPLYLVSGDETLLVSENESTFIPLGVRHRLENPGKLLLEMIEVQSGAYLGEDDIVRFEDTYGRHGQ